MPGGRGELLMDDTQRELDVLIRARYPILYIVSWEEPRVMRTLRQIATQHNKDLLCWTITDGWTGSDGKTPIRMPDPLGAGRRSSTAPPRRTRSSTVEIDQALEALDLVEHWGEGASANRRGALFVLKDFDPYVTAPSVERRLRDLAQMLPYSSYKTILIVSPSLKVAPHLDKDITVVDYELPGKDDIEGILDRIIKTVTRDDASLVELTPEDKEALVNAALGLTSAEAENVFAKALVMDGRLGRMDVSVVLSEKKQVVRKSGTLEYYESDQHFADIGGLSALKDWLRKRRSSFTAKARDFGLPEPRGCLLIGVQGCGKSLAAKAVGALWNVPLLRFDVGSVFGRYVGESESNMRQAIAVAEAVAPCVLWIDELEKGFSGMSGGEDSGTSARVLSYFLTWLQEKKKAVFVICTANDVQKLPPELLRKGRLDEIFFIDLPSFAERREITEIHLRRRNRDPAKYDMDRIANEARGFSGSEIEQAIIGALFDAFDAGRDINTDDISAVLKVTVPISKTMAERIQGLREWADERARPATFPEDAADPGDKQARTRRATKVTPLPPAEAPAERLPAEAPPAEAPPAAETPPKGS
ncbi:MAG: AAA family ATPase [Armatimonadetes bacterium]|nr:AAA family ATPase [Armatimonadota bacterium]